MVITKKATALLACAAAFGVSSIARAASETWTGAVAATNTSTNTYPAGTALWDTSTQNWVYTGTSTPTTFVTGDNAVFTDNPGTGFTNIATSGNTAPNSIEFTHASGGTAATTYTFLFGSTSVNGFGSSTPFNAVTAPQFLTLDSGFLGTAAFQSRSTSTQLRGSTVINGGTLQIGDAGALPSYDTNSDPYVTLNGGALSIAVGYNGNFQPSSSQLIGRLNVLSNSTLINGATAALIANGGGTGSQQGTRTWNGTIDISPGATLFIDSTNQQSSGSIIEADLGASILPTGGTVSLGATDSIVRIDSVYGGSTGVLYDLGTGGGILRNDLSAGQTLALGALTGSATSILSGSEGSGAATSYAVGNFESSTFAGIMQDYTSAAGLISSTALNKVGAGTTLTLTGQSTNTGATRVTAGTLNLDFAGTGAPASNILSSVSDTYTSGASPVATAGLILAGGNLLLTGVANATNTQQFTTGTSVVGPSTVQLSAASGNSLSLGLGAIAHSTGGTVDFTLPSGTQTASNGISTTTPNASFTGGQSTILGGYATVGGNTWAVSGSGTTPGVITGLATSSYTNTATTPLASAAADDIDVAAAGNNAVTSALTVNSLRFNDGSGASTIDATGGLTVATGGILETSAVGSNAVAINNGTLTSGNGTDLLLINRSPSSTMTIGSQVTGTIGLTVAGSGNFVLSNSANSYTGSTFLTGGVTNVSADTDLGAAPATATGGQLTLNGGTLQAGGSFTLTANRGVAIGVNGGTIDTQANNLTIAGIITTSGSYGSGTYGPGAITKIGSGTLTYTGVNTYTGPTNIQNGTLVLASGSAVGATAVTLGSGTTSGVLQLGDSNAAVNTTLSGLATSGTGTGNAVVGGNSTNSVLTISNPVDETYAGVIGGSGTNQNNISLTKLIAVTQAKQDYNPTTLTLSGANTFNGPLTITAGTVSVSSLNSVATNASLGTVHSASSNLGSPTTAANGEILLNGNSGPAILLYTGPGETTDRQIVLGNGSYTATIDSSGTGPVSFVSNVSVTGTSAKQFILQGSNTGNNNFAGVISDYASNAATSVTKLGTGTWNLSAANTYTGTTYVDGGTLVASNTSGSATGPGTGTIAATSSAPAETVNVYVNNGTLASGTVGTIYSNVYAGTYTATGNNTGGTASTASIYGGIGSPVIAPGGVGSIGTLTLGGLTTNSNTTLNFDLGTANANNGDLLVLGTAASTVTAATSIAAGTDITFGADPTAAGDYRLIGGTTEAGITLSDFVLPSAPAGDTYSLSNTIDPGYIDLVVAAAGPVNLTFSGAVNGNWDFSTANFNNGTSNVAYTDGSNVTFNDNNNNQYAVTLNQTVSPGSTTFSNSAGNYTVSGTGTIAGSGTLTKAGTGTVTLSTANTYTGLTTVKAGSLVLDTNAQSPVLNSAGANVQGGKLVFDYNGGTDPINTIKTDLTAAYNASGGPFSSGQIYSSTAVTGKYGLGYADNTTTSQVTVMYTLYGDANLDGSVSIADFNALAANFGLASGATWAEGDFNYDGSVSIADFNLLAANFGDSLVNGVLVSGTDVDYAPLLAFAEAHNDVAGFEAAINSVPEPTTLGIMVVGALAMSARRRRSSGK